MYFTSKPVTVIESGRLETTKLNFFISSLGQECGNIAPYTTRGISTSNSAL